MYGILKTATNTGLDSELVAVFSTPLKIKSNVPGYAQDTNNLRRIASTSVAQRWEIEAAIVPTNNSAEFFTHNVINNFGSKIYVRVPQMPMMSHGAYGKSATTPVGAPIGSKPLITTVAQYAAGSSVLSAAGLGTYDFAIGEFIQFAGDNKVYLIKHPGVKGIGFEVFPALRTPKLAGVQIIYGDAVTMHAYYDNSNSFGIGYSDGVLTDPGTFTLVEAL